MQVARFRPREVEGSWGVPGFLVLGCAAIAIFSTPVKGQGTPRDWSNDHIIFPNSGTLIEAMNAGSMQGWIRKANDPRFLAQQGRKQSRVAAAGTKTSPATSTARDWNVAVGSNVAKNMSPATYSANGFTSPDCANDYVVYALQTSTSSTGAGGQPTIVAFNQLYTGGSSDANSNGLCASGLTTPKWLPRIKWSFNTRTLTGGQILTSPSVSSDGTKIAFVETATGTSLFKVLTLGSAQGGTTGASSLSVAPTFAPGASGSSISSLSYGSAKNSNSSPFINYFTDQAVVGNDAGVLCLIKNVFGGTPALDTSWSTGCVSVASGTTLTGAAWDTVNNKIFVGSSNGTLYAIDPANGSTLASWSLGSNITITDAPTVDVGGSTTAPRVYAFANNTVTGDFIVAQADLALAAGSQVTRTAGKIATTMHAGYFNDIYYTNPVSANSYLFVCAGATTGLPNKPALWRIPFSAGTGSAFSLGTPVSVVQIVNTNSAECSPMTGILNPNGGGANVSKEWLFVSDGAKVSAFDVTNPTSIPAATTLSQSGGTSAIVIDNLSSSAQASSVYFTPLGANNAVKATQNGLQ